VDLIQKQWQRYRDSQFLDCPVSNHKSTELFDKPLLIGGWFHRPCCEKSAIPGKPGDKTKVSYIMKHNNRRTNVVATCRSSAIYMIPEGYELGAALLSI
jgi:hypothetical protein